MCSLFAACSHGSGRFRIGSMVSMKDKVVLVTGASAGIGKATAEAFAREGARLIVAARRREKLDAVESALRDAGAAAINVIELDVRERERVNSAIEALPAEWRAIDVLVNNAGL